MTGRERDEEKRRKKRGREKTRDAAVILPERRSDKSYVGWEGRGVQRGGLLAASFEF